MLSTLGLKWQPLYRTGGGGGDICLNHPFDLDISTSVAAAQIQQLMKTQVKQLSTQG